MGCGGGKEAGRKSGRIVDKRNESSSGFYSIPPKKKKVVNRWISCPLSSPATIVKALELLTPTPPTASGFEPPGVSRPTASLLFSAPALFLRTKRDFHAQVSIVSSLTNERELTD